MVYTTDQVAKKIYDRVLRQKYSIISCTYASYVPHNPRLKGESVNQQQTFVAWKAEINDICVLWYASAQFFCG